MPQRPAEEAFVARVQPLEPLVEALQGPADEVGVVALLDVGVDPPRGEHRVEGEAHEERGEDGGGDRDAELVEEAPDHAAHEGDGHEDRDDGEGGRHDREADLGGAVAGGVEVVLAALQVPHDVLADDDRVVDQHPDREGEAHEGQHVQGEAEDPHGDERGDDGDGQGDPGDDGGAPGVEEEEDDEDGQEAADDHRGVHVLDRLADEDRVVLDDGERDPGRQLLLQLLDGLRGRRPPPPRCWLRTASGSRAPARGARRGRPRSSAPRRRR